LSDVGDWMISVLFQSAFISLTFFLELFQIWPGLQKENLWDNWSRFSHVGCPFCCRTNSIKALKELETLTPTEEKSPTRLKHQWHPTKRDVASFTFTPDLHPENF